MLTKIREKLLAFIYSDKDAPLLAGLSIGVYMLIFYYSKNFSLANSWVQFLFFTGYYIALPMVAIYAEYRLLKLTKFSHFKKQFIAIAMVVVFSYFLLNLISIGFSKKITFALIVLAAVLLSGHLKKYYRFFILLLFFLSLFNLPPVIKIGFTAMSASDDWQKQPDDIENITFKQRPNIYYIQPDGYTNSENLRDTVHNFDNSAFEAFLAGKGFTTYRSFRSNYFSTLLSNASMFSMKHHYIQDDINLIGARDVIIGDNALLKIVKHNNYKTIFITEKPYLIMNRPPFGYDYCNIPYSEIPFIKDGWAMHREIDSEIKSQAEANGKSGNFYFIEKFIPNHIAVRKDANVTAESEREKYLANIKQANKWLQKTVNYITANDADALIIIGADHGGFVGFEDTMQSLTKTTDANKIRSVFGSHLSVKWNRAGYTKYDDGLKSSVNLFRTVFSFLAEDTKYLENLQENSSYILLDKPAGLYRYIDDNGKVVTEEVKAKNL